MTALLMLTKEEFDLLEGNPRFLELGAMEEKDLSENEKYELDEFLRKFFDNSPTITVSMC